MYTANISRPTNDRDRHQASHPSASAPRDHGHQLTANVPLLHSLAVSCYMVAGAFGNLTWSTYAGFCELHFPIQSS